MLFAGKPLPLRMALARVHQLAWARWTRHAFEDLARQAAISDIVELASRRCLVGSAPSCDVRVNEPGVAPIECLIFHGAKNNVVRWLGCVAGIRGR